MVSETHQQRMNHAAKTVWCAGVYAALEDAYVVWWEIHACRAIATDNEKLLTPLIQNRSGTVELFVDTSFDLASQSCCHR